MDNINFDEILQPELEFCNVLKEMLASVLTDMRFGIGSEAVAYLKDIAEIITCYPSLHKYLAVVKDYLAFANAEYGDHSEAIIRFGPSSSSSMTETVKYSYPNLCYYWQLLREYDASISEGWICAENMLLSQNYDSFIKILCNLAKLNCKTGAFKQAININERALEQLEDVEDSSLLLPYIHVSMGNVYFGQQRYTEARHCYEAVVPDCEIVDEDLKYLVGQSFVNIALCYHLQGDYVNSADNFEKSINLLVEIGSVFDFSAALVHYSCTLYLLDQCDGSIILSKKAIEVFKNFECEMTTQQKSVAATLSLRAYAWMACANIKKGYLLRGLSCLEYSREMSAIDADMIFDGTSTIGSQSPDDWIPITLKKLNAPIFMQHVIRLEGMNERLLSFLILPLSDLEFKIHYIGRSFADKCDMREWIASYLDGMGIQGWNYKTFRNGGRRLSRANDLDEEKVDSCSFRRGTDEKSSVKLLEVLMRYFIDVVYFIIATMCLFWLNHHQTENIEPKTSTSTYCSPKTVLKKVRSSSRVCFKSTVTSKLSEVISCKNKITPLHHAVDRTQEFIFLKRKYGISPIEPPYTKELAVARELYDIFIEPFHEEFDSLGAYGEILLLVHDCAAFVPFNALLDPLGCYMLDRYKFVYVPSVMMAAHLLYRVEERKKNNEKAAACSKLLQPGIWRNPILSGKTNFTNFSKLGSDKELKMLQFLLATYGIQYKSYDADRGPILRELCDGLMNGSLLHIATHSTVSSIVLAGEDYANILSDAHVNMLCEEQRLSPDLIVLNTSICGVDNYLLDNADGLVRAFLSNELNLLNFPGVICVVRSISALDDNIAMRFVYYFYKILLDSMNVEKSDSTFTNADVADAVHLSMLKLSSFDRRKPQSWSHYMATGLWVTNNGAMI